MMHKFVDDTTLTEIVAKSDRRRMQANCNELAQQANEAWMNVSCRKMKEMLISMIIIRNVKIVFLTKPVVVL